MFDDQQPVHTYFALTYSNFQVIHRSIAQSMPREWQKKFVALMEEADRAVRDHNIEVAPSYTLQARNAAGKFIKDPVPHYNRGRTRLFPTPTP